MTWPFDRPVNQPSVEEGHEEAPVEKTPAELIAESLSTALKPVMDKLTEQDQRFATLEEATKRPERTAVEDGERPQPISVLDDENAAFAQRMTPLLARQYEIEARIVKKDIRDEYVAAGYGELWSKYVKEIDATIDGSPLVTNDGKSLRGDPQYIRNVVDMIFGRAARGAGMRFDGKNNGFFLETATGSVDNSAVTEQDGMNEGQRQVASRMKISPADAKKVMGKLKFVS